MFVLKLIFISIVVLFCTNPVRASHFQQDGLILIDNYKEFSHGSGEHTQVVNDNNGYINLSCNFLKFYSTGIYISPVFETKFPAEELYPSWNIICPKEKAGFVIYLRVSEDRLNWSPWFYLGSWGKHPQIRDKVIKNDSGYVDTDYLSLKTGVRFIQYSIRLFSSDDRYVTPRVKLFAIAYGKRTEEKKEEVIAVDKVTISAQKRLYVPYRSQGDEEPSISGRICSPTSIAMVMAYWGINIPTADVAKMSYDKEHDIYGSWPIAVQVASQYGLKGWVQIFTNWDDVEEKINSGIPVIAAICFGIGELHGSRIQSSEGHIIVITGFDESGNPICNDPAGSNVKEGIIAYNRVEFARAWFGKTGIGYVIINDRIDTYGQFR